MAISQTSVHEYTVRDARAGADTVLVSPATPLTTIGASRKYSGFRSLTSVVPSGRTSRCVSADRRSPPGNTTSKGYFPTSVTANVGGTAGAGADDGAASGGAAPGGGCD